METGIPNPQFEISTAKRQTLTDLNVQVFDPTENTSLWSKWRTAVNAQLYNKTQLREQHKQLDGFSDSFTEAPLSEYLSVSTKTRRMAHVMMTPENCNYKGTLRTAQFIYYGIPRMVVRDGEASARDSDSLLFIPKKRRTKYKLSDVVYY